MATDPKTTETKKTVETADAPGRPADANQAVLKSVMVLKVKKSGKKKNKRYTRGTKALQRFTYGLTRAAYRVTNSFAEGAKTFRDRSNKSSRKRKDGLVRDSLRNLGKAVSDGVKEISDAPNEITRRISTRRVWRTIRILN